MDLPTITDEILSQVLETQTRSELSSDLLEDESQEAAEHHETTISRIAQPAPTDQTRSELNSDLLEEENQFIQPTSNPPETPIFPDEMEVYQPEDETSVSSFDFINKIEVNAIASFDNQESNSMSLGLPDSLLMAEDVWKEPDYMVQSISNAAVTNQLGVNKGGSEPADTTNNAKASDSLEEVEIYPNETNP